MTRDLFRRWIFAAGLACASAVTISRTAEASPVLLVSRAESIVRVTHVIVVVRGDEVLTSFMPDYTGPKEDFSVVFVVPDETTVADLLAFPRALHHRVEAISAPRFVEFWEKDPCDPGPAEFVSDKSELLQEEQGDRNEETSSPPPSAPSIARSRQYYEPMVGTPSELEHWLAEQGLELSGAAEKMLKEYALSGMKVAGVRVSAERLHFFDDVGAILPPVGFRSKGASRPLAARFGLPSLGLHHDLYIYAFAEKRMRLANYPTRFSVTNVPVEPLVRTSMPEFYNQLFDEFQSRYPSTFLQEYAFDAAGCAEPCPTQRLSSAQLRQLGGVDNEALTLSRLHYRYGKHELPVDPLLAEGAPVVGGVSAPQGREAQAEQGVHSKGAQSRFVTRFLHVHRYEKAPSCSAPQRYRWGKAPVTPPEPPEVFIAEGGSRRERKQFDLPRVIGSQTITFAEVSGEGTFGRKDSDNELRRMRRTGCACGSSRPSSGLGSWWMLSFAFGLVSLYVRRLKRQR